MNDLAPSFLILIKNKMVELAEASQGFSASLVQRCYLGNMVNKLLIAAETAIIYKNIINEI